MSCNKTALGLLIIGLIALAIHFAFKESGYQPSGLKKEVGSKQLPQKAEPSFLIPATPDELPEPKLFCSNREKLANALDKNIQYLLSQKPDKKFLLGKQTITVSDLLKTNKRLKDILKYCNSVPPEEFKKTFWDSFYVLKLISSQETALDPSKNNHKPMLVTGYFQPELKASLVQTPEFKVPLYGIPKNLISVQLKRFDSTLPSRTLFGMVSGNKLVPYLTRCQIDYGQGLKDGPVLAYVQSQVDALTLHIQGSGLLALQNGERRYIHYAASNGRPYRSVANWLIRKGYMKASQANWPKIKKWAIEHPNLFQQALCKNPRYIFFKWENDGPYGSMGVTLTPMVSVALDPKVYPLGLTGVLNTTIFLSGKKSNYTAIVVNQDMGNAIRSPYRLDLYCGHGKAGELIAGRLKTPSKFFVLIARD